LKWFLFNSKLNTMHTSEFIHPEDSAALRQMESIPGFPQLIKKVMSVGYETLQYGLNMASNIRLSETQLPEIYRLLPPICEKLEIPVPEFYLRMDPNPNAETSGDTRIWITVNSSLIELLSEEELISVLAHECGHIKCRHVLYHTVGQWVNEGIASLGILGTLADPMRYALLYWSRKSELSADRAAALVTSPEIVANVQARLAGGPFALTKNVNIPEWITQADLYEQIKNDGMWNKTLQTIAIAKESHPFSAVRVREILKWGATDQYQCLLNKMEASGEKGSKKYCPNCGKSVDPEWIFCQHCGCKI
jgi:Zn-dependent protease with chaperone function